jgi:hypothetical protein
VRLGNTILTGNETIQGSLSVNGSLTLNSGDSVDNTNVVYYDSLDISNTLSVGGDVSISGELTTGNITISGTPTDTDHAINKGYVDSQNPSFKAFRTDETLDTTVSLTALQKIPYNTIQHDTLSGYDTSNYNYTIKLAGRYYFFANWFGQGGHNHQVYIRKNEVYMAIGRLTNAIGSSSNTASTIIECLVDDVIDVYVGSPFSGAGIISLITTTASPEGNCSFYGYRIGV